jgi:hypothetical protein
MEEQKEKKPKKEVKWVVKKTKSKEFIRELKSI